MKWLTLSKWGLNAHSTVPLGAPLGHRSQSLAVETDLVLVVGEGGRQCGLLGAEGRLLLVVE